MTALPKHLIGAIVAFVVVGLLGGGAWFWTSSQLDQAIQSRSEVMQQLSALTAKGIFPSAANLKTLKDNQEQAAALGATMEPALAAGASALAPYIGPDGKGLGPDAWKQLLIEKREELKKQAESAKVQVADDFYFGFKRYRLASPPAAATRELGVQLAGIEAISRVLIEARIHSLAEIRRVMVEEVGGTPGMASTEEALAAVVAEGPGGLYRVYPFEVRLQASASSLQKMVNLFSAQKQFFIIRSLSLENQKTGVPRRSEILAQAGLGNADPGGPEPSRAAAPARLMIPVLGQELLNVRLRVDLILWEAPAPAQAQSTTPNTTGS